ncbi:MAG: Dyp-type peroxidase [Protaetiibacter sp.]
MSDEPAADAPSPARGVTRRELLLGGGGLGAGLVAGALAGAAVGSHGSASEPTPDAEPAATGAPVPAFGEHQAGIDRPATPQRNGLVAVAELPGEPDAAAVLALLAAAGELALRCTDPENPDRTLVPDGPGDLTVTIGIGPRLVRALDVALPGADELPVFASDTELDPAFSGGDLLVAAYSSDASALHAVVPAVLEGAGATLRWAQQGVRGAGDGMVARNPLGYHDGVIVPHTAEEYAEGVWIADGPAAGGTIVVIRRLRLDLAAFRALSGEERDRVIGRERMSGAPLSGGEREDEADLTAKTPEGEYLVPLHSHVRAAHPSFTGSPLMLRRGYAFSNTAGPGADDGLLFMCYLNELGTFVRTQHRLDETDDLMRFTTVTASASFLIPPGRRTADEPLGATLAG